MTHTFVNGNEQSAAPTNTVATDPVHSGSGTGPPVTRSNEEYDLEARSPSSTAANPPSPRYEASEPKPPGSRQLLEDVSHSGGIAAPNNGANGGINAPPLIASHQQFALAPEPPATTVAQPSFKRSNDVNHQGDIMVGNNGAHPGMGGISAPRLERLPGYTFVNEGQNSMAQRQNIPPPNSPTIHPCSHLGCGKQFARPCELSMHSKVHSRPYKCTEPTCKYATVGWPTRAECKRHVHDRHMQTQVWHLCPFTPCEWKSKRKSNVKQHMERAHGWKYERSKGHRRGGESQFISAASATGNPRPVLPEIPTPSVRQQQNPGVPAPAARQPHSFPVSTGQQILGFPSQNGEEVAGFPAQSGQQICRFPAQVSEQMADFSVQTSEQVPGLQVPSGEQMPGFPAQTNEETSGFSVTMGEQMSGFQVPTSEEMAGFRAPTRQ